MSKHVLKFVVITVAIAGGFMLLGSGKAAAATYENDNCPGAPSEDWGNHGSIGEGDGVMAAMTVYTRSSAATGSKPINTSYTLKSRSISGGYNGQIFDYSQYVSGKGGRTNQHTFRTGENLYGRASGAFSCNGWSQLAAGTTVDGNRLVGNGWIVDCRDNNNKPVEYWLSDVKAPDGETGKWSLIKSEKDKISGQWVNREITDDVNGAAIDATKFGVENGGNIRLTLVWTPDIDWTLKGYTNVEDSTIAAGENTTFHHKVHNQGQSDARYYWHLEGCYKANGNNCTEADFSGGNDGSNAISSAGKPNTHNGSPDSVGQGNDVPNNNAYNYKFDSGAPNGARYCQRINYTNKDGPSTAEGHSDSDCTVKSPHPGGDDRPVEVECNVVRVRGYGTYSEGNGNGGTVERETRAKVNIGGAWITHTYWSKDGPDNGDSGELGYTNRDASDNYVPNSNGSTKTTDWKQWNLVPYNQDITVTVQYQYKQGGTTWTNFNGGGGNNPAAPNKDRGASNPIPCFRPTCTVNAVHGNLFDNQSVEAGKPAYVSVTINNPDPNAARDGVPLRDAYVQGYGKDSDRVDIDPGSSKTLPWIQINAPTTPQNWTVKFNLKSGVSDGLPAITCERPASVYKLADFDYTPNATLDDQENPTTITYSTNVTSNFATTVNLPTFHSVSKVPPSTLIDQPNPQPTTLPPSGFHWGGTSPVAPGSVQVGDQFCTTIWSGAMGSNHRITGGYVDVNGNITAPTYADAAIDCDTVHNEPYVHFNGADVSAGGKFKDESGICDLKGEINTFSKEPVGTSPPIGSGVHIGALAIGPINGFSSANIRGSSSDPAAPIGLSFSNTDNNTGGSGNARHRGGKLGGNNCVTDYYGTTKPSDTPVSTGNSVDISANSPTVSKVANYYEPPSGTALNITGGNIANNNSKAIYVKGDVRITGDIKLDDSWGTIEAIPSLYIIASGNIYIDPGVKQLDGIYIAQPRQGAPPDTTGYINTCADGTARYVLTSPAIWTDCRSQLVVNGAFIAKGVYLDRVLGTLRKGQSGEHYTKGSPGRDCDGINKDTGDCAAEIFNFGPEQYLAQPAIKPISGPNKGIYDYITSLAPVL